MSDRQRESMIESEGTDSDEQEEDKGQNEEENNKKTARTVKKVEFVKQYNFIDDNTFYKRRILYKDVDAYWRWLVTHHYRQQLRPDFVSWMEKSRQVDYSIEVKHYPLIPVTFLRITTHFYWDYVYLWLVIFFFILLGLDVDNFLDDYYEVDTRTMILPLLAMIVSQIVPVIGAMVGVVYMNDLAKFLSNAQIDRWAVNAVLVAQYMEFAYYGGHNRLDKATKIRLDQTRSETMKYSVKNPVEPTFMERAAERIGFLLRLGRAARVINEDEVEEDQEEEPNISYFLNDEGKMVYIDDDGNEVELTQEDLDLLVEAEKEEASVVESMEGSQASKSAVGSQVSYQSRIEITEGTSNKDIEMMEVGEGGKRKKISTGEKLRQKKEKLRLVQEAAEKLIEEEENFDDGVELGREGGFLQRREAERKAAKAEALRQKMVKKMTEEEGCTDWWEWDCVICKNYNRRPTELKPNFDTTFVTKGVFFKHTVVALRPTSLVPTCERCHTPADYEPRLCNKHFIQDIPEPHAAFENYPESIPRLPRHWLLRAYDLIVSFFWGRRNHPDSKLMANDWRLSIYLSSMFPEIKRHIKKPEDFYVVGEIVECKLQKSDWSRARITYARASRAYDIKYDSGDVVRLVDEKALRLPPAKGWYAYRVELVMVWIIIGFPLSLFLAISAQDAGMVFLPLLLGCGILLCLRLVSFARGFTEYYTAGCLALSLQAAIFILPPLLFVVSSLLSMNAGSLGLSWILVSIIMIVGIVCSLPYLYMKRVTFAYRLLPLIVFFAVGSINASFRLDGAPIDMYATVTITPGVIIAWRMMRFRSDLGSIWDVSLLIRPVGDAKFEPTWIIRQVNALLSLVRSRREQLDEVEDDELGMEGIEDAAEPSQLISIKSIDGPESIS